jgi:hypothetical protein
MKQVHNIKKSTICLYKAHKIYIEFSLLHVPPVDRPISTTWTLSLYNEIKSLFMQVYQLKAGPIGRVV